MEHTTTSDERIASDPRVTAIRKDAKVGRGTCSMIDECYSAEELVEELDAKGITTPAGAVKWAHDYHDLWHGYHDDIAATAW